MRDNLVNLEIIAKALEQALCPRQFGIAAKSVRHAIREIERLRAQVEGQNVGQPHPTFPPTIGSAAQSAGAGSAASV